jgi:hypothetical protein
VHHITREDEDRLEYYYPGKMPPERKTGEKMWGHRMAKNHLKEMGRERKEKASRARGNALLPKAVACVCTSVM